MTLADKLRLAADIVEGGLSWEHRATENHPWCHARPDILTAIHMGHEIRIKPEPKWVALGPEDVPPGSVLRCTKDQPRVSFWCLAMVDEGGVGLATDAAATWDQLFRHDYEIKRPGEDWTPCKKLKENN
jgi:hypothetical protein